MFSNFYFSWLLFLSLSVYLLGEDNWEKQFDFFFLRQWSPCGFRKKLTEKLSPLQNVLSLVLIEETLLKGIYKKRKYFLGRANIDVKESQSIGSICIPWSGKIGGAPLRGACTKGRADAKFWVLWLLHMDYLHPNTERRYSERHMKTSYLHTFYFVSPSLYNKDPRFTFHIWEENKCKLNFMSKYP